MTRKSTNYFGKALEHVLINYRWIFVCLFLLPASVLFDVYYYFRHYIVFKWSSAKNAHQAKVRNVQEQVRDWDRRGRPNKMCTARPSWMTMGFRHAKYKKTLTNITVNLVDILEVNTVRKVVLVEPLVTMGQLTSTLLSEGWTLPVVPELDDLTVGGLIMGTGVETSSHKYGLFQHTCVSFDMVMSNGSLVHCSKDENSDLFYSVPWSHGSLGFLVRAEISIIPAKSHINLSYIPFNSLETFHARFTAESNNMANDFVEGIVFDSNQAVLMVGILSDKPQDPVEEINAIGNYYKRWFYTHVESKLQSPDVTNEFIPLRQYYHRHTKSLFWELEDIIPFGNHPLFRYILGWAVPPKISFLKLTQPETVRRLYDQHHVIQDLLVPVENTLDAVKHMQQLVNIYPLWICPMRIFEQPGILNTPDKKDHLFIDLGIYGVATTPNYIPIVTTRQMEETVRNVKGFQMLYADSFMTRDEFRTMFDHELHDKLRVKYHASDAFPDIYEKVCRAARH